MMNLVFVHGWSVTNTDTYGDLPEALVASAGSQGVELIITHVHLGRYVSFRDEVTVDDISRAFNQALIDTLATGPEDLIPEFSCITHSTGGPVVREWVERFYGKTKLDTLPLKHLIMLSPANHGSALAALGKKRVGRIKAWWDRVEPGQRVLDWLTLGSNEQWQLAQRQLAYSSAQSGYFPFVITGQTIDEKLYDFINPYLAEKGSDGVVRVAACNMNYRYAKLEQSETTIRKRPLTFGLENPDGIVSSEKIALGVISDASHSGKNIGIMASVNTDNRTEKPVIDMILTCLKTETSADYDTCAQFLRQVTDTTQGADQKMSRYAMLVFQVQDDRGELLEDYDLLILAGKKYDAGKLPKGFFVDRQKNNSTGRLTYYVDADKISDGLDAIGFRIVARPEKGMISYAEAEFRSGELPVAELIKANQTLYVNVVLKRRVAKNVFRFGPVSKKPYSFKKERPDPNILDD